MASWFLSQVLKHLGAMQGPCGLQGVTPVAPGDAWLGAVEGI